MESFLSSIIVFAIALIAVAMYVSLFYLLVLAIKKKDVNLITMSAFVLFLAIIAPIALAMEKKINNCQHSCIKERN